MKRRRRRAYRPAYRKNSGARRTDAPRPRSRAYAAPAAPAPLSWSLLRVVICGAVFVSLIALKLLMPEKMTAVRGKLDAWLVRDADFASAFSAVGHAVSGEGGALDALEDAYIAVFGGEKGVEEVSGKAEVAAGALDKAGAAAEAGGEAERPANVAARSAEQPQAADELPPRPYPEHTDAAQHVLGFDYAAPLKGTKTSDFGWREDPVTGRETFHYGVDLAADEGTEIDCFADGTVGVVAESVELGKYLTVHHANGVMTLYAHCSRITVPSGAAVKRGEKLAEVGSTGNATGPHLHFEIHDGNTYLDPAYYC